MPKGPKIAVIKPEKPGARPRYRPGDIVTCKDGGVGVITEVESIYNGHAFSWNEDPPDEPFEHGHPPGYSLAQIPGEPKLKYEAWWEATKWRKVELGPLHFRKKKA